MIHTIVVTPETELDELKKLFRKKLMTGGAVARLPQELSAAECRTIFEKFQPHSEQHSIASEVLRQLARHPRLPEDLQQRLNDLGSPLLNQDLRKGEDLRKRMNGA